jgi:ParB family chromosome partitioning protein
MGYGRDIIMLALAVDKAALSHMISIATRVPDTVIDAIGPAPGVGRPRWIELADLIERRKTAVTFERMLESDKFRSAASDRRFDLLASFSASSGEMENRSTAKKGRGQASAFETRRVNTGLQRMASAA